MQEFNGPLEVDAARGKYNQFLLNGHQIVFPDDMFEVRQLNNSIYDPSIPVQVGRHLTKAGLDLYAKVNALGGRGVTIMGESFDRWVRFTQDTSRPQSCIVVRDIKENPACNPVLMPELVDFIAEAERQRQIKADQDKAEKLRQMEQAEELELMREEIRERRKGERKKQPA